MKKVEPANAAGAAGDAAAPTFGLQEQFDGGNANDVQTRDVDDAKAESVKPTKGLRITQEALRVLLKEMRDAFVRVGDLTAAQEIGARNSSSRLHVGENVIGLKPETAMERAARDLLSLHSIARSAPEPKERADVERGDHLAPANVAGSEPAISGLLEPRTRNAAANGASKFPPQVGGVEEAALFSQERPNANPLEATEGQSLDARWTPGRAPGRPQGSDPGNAPDDLPEKIDYSRKSPGSRPVLVIALSGAAGGGNPSLAELTRELGGRVYLSTSDQHLAEALAAINRFQREHPDGIVVVLAYSYGGRALRTSIAGRTMRPIDVAVLFDPYNDDDETMSFAPGSIKHGLNYYQRDETDSPWYSPFGGHNPFRGSRVTNPEFTNVDLTGKTAKQRHGSKIGHNSIVNDASKEDELKGMMDPALRR